MNKTSSEGKEIKIPGPDHPITISPAEGKVRVTVAGKIVAESNRAFRLEENFVAFSGISPADYLRRLHDLRNDGTHPIKFNHLPLGG